MTYWCILSRCGTAPILILPCTRMYVYIYIYMCFRYEQNPFIDIYYSMMMMHSDMWYVSRRHFNQDLVGA